MNNEHRRRSEQIGRKFLFHFPMQSEWSQAPATTYKLITMLATYLSLSLFHACTTPIDSHFRSIDRTTYPSYRTYLSIDYRYCCCYYIKSAQIDDDGEMEGGGNAGI